MPSSQVVDNPDEEFRATANSAVCQDAYIFGIDVDDHVAMLDQEFGPVVLTIAWLDYTDQTSSYRGCSAALFPLIILLSIPRKLFLREALLPHPDPLHHGHRLILAHIAQVIDKGEWFEP